MAIEDICKIPPPPPVPPAGAQNGEAGGANDEGEGDAQPEIIPQRLEAGEAPYPQPYRQVGNQSLGNDHIPLSLIHI